jgi:hypothetical protein
MSTGKTYSTKYLQDSKNNRGSEGQILSSTSSGIDWVTLSEISGVDGTGTANYLSKWLDANTITNSLVYDNGTNVGIGNTSPLQKLSVNGIINSDQNEDYYGAWMSGNSASGQNSYFAAGTWYNNAGYFKFIQSGTPHRLSIYTFNTADHVTLQEAGGNVGIGTVNPLTKLHINDGVNLNLKAGGSGSEFQIKATNDADTAYIPIITRASKYSILNGNVGIGATSPTATLQVGDNYTINASYGGSALYIKSTGSNISSYDPQITSTSDIGSLITISDNTTTGPTKAGLVLYNDDVTVGGFSPMLLFSKRESGSSPYKATMAGIYARSPLGTGDNDAWIDGELIFATAGAASHGIKQRMVIDKEGNVGIGTTNPSQKLHVVGNTITTGVSYTDIVQTYSGSSIDFRHQDASVVMRVDTPNARVGIGTTSPATKLHVVGRARFDDTQINAKGVFADYFSSGQSLTLNSGASASILFKIGNTTALTLDSSQNATFAGTITSANILPISDAAYTIGGGSSSLRWNYLYLNNTLSITDGNINAGTTFDFNQGANFLGDLTVSGGNITLGGTGRIQGVDTVTDATDAANKAYVDAQVGASDTLQEVTDNGNTTTNSVGIGASSSPSFTSGGGLQITNATQANLRLSDSSNASYNLDLAMSNDDFYLVNRSATGHLKFRVNNSTEAITVLQDGNVGIGITGPSKPLDVQSAATSIIANFKYTAAAYSSIDLSNSVGVARISSLNNDLLLSPAGTERLRISSTGAIKFNAYGAGTFTGTVTQKLGVDSSGNVIEMPIGAGPVDGSGTANYLARWIDSDTLGIGAAYDNGTNVGIGTTNPTDKLDVAGALRLTSNTTFDATKAGRIYKASNLGLAIHGVTGSTNDFAMFTPAGQLMLVNPTGTNNVVLIPTAAGNVGIGTTSPSNALEISNASFADQLRILRPQNTEGGIAGIINIAGINSASVVKDYARIGVIIDDNTNATEDGSLVLQTITNGTNTEKVRINSLGNVGIGTTNPSRKFEVHEGNVYLKVGAQSGYTDGYGPILTTNSNSIVAPERVYLAASQAYIRRENIGGQGLTLHGDTFSRFTYYNGSSTVEALRIDNSGNVGIGTTNPSTKLQVAGTSRFDGDLTVANSTLSITAAAPNLLFAVPSGGLDSRIFNDGSGNFIIGHGTNSNSPTERLRIDSAGNVGIGTVSPQAALHVAGAIPVAPTGSGVLMGLQSNYAIIHLNGSTGGIIDFSSSGVDRKGRILYDNTGNYMQIQTNGSNKVRIDSAGKVGIGTVSPATILDLDDGTVSDIRIRGNATTDVRFAGIAFYNTAGSDTVAAVNVDRDGANDAGALTFDTQPAGGGNTERLRISSTGAIKFNNYGAGTFTGTVTQKLGVDSSGNVIEMPIGAGPVDGSGTANYLARWIDSDTLGIGAAYDNGTNVGIGTNTPNSLLNVQGDSDPTILINAVTGNSTNSGKLAFAETDGGALQAWIKYDGSANRLELGTSDVPQALVIKRTDGNVGIGTTNPSQKFEVVGQAIIDGGVGVSSSGTLHLRQQGNTSSDGLAITSAYGTSHRIWKDVNGKLNIGPSNLPSSFVQDVNGNVGIGTTNPAKKLEVNGSFKLGTNAYIEYGGTYPYTITTANTAAVGNLVFSAGLGSTGYESKIELQGTNVAADAAITLSTASSAKVTILNNGNVGIGITNPSTKLHVSGIVQIAASGETAFYEGNGVRVFGTQNYRFRNTGGGVRAIIDVNSTGVSAGNLSLYNASNVITSYINNAGNSYYNGGNIGIGTTSPTHKLDVRGDILVKGGSTQHSVIRFRRSNLTYDFAYIGFENPAAANDEFLISSAGNGNPMKIQAGASKAINFYGNTTAYGGFNGSGNFGIGTTSPNYQLDVRDGIVFAGRAVSDDGGISYTNTAAVFSSRGVDHDASRTNVLRLMRDGTTGVQYAGLADFDLESWESSGVYSRTAMTLKLGHGNLPSDTADVMTWRSNGNVGIGTTSPSQKLQINGVEGLPATTGTSQNALLRLTPNAPTNGESLDFGMRVSGSDSIGWIQATNFGNLGTNYDIALNPNGGNVGIGTTNPATKLSVSGGDISAYTSNGTSRIFVSENGTTGFNGLVMQCNGGANNTDFYTTNTGNGMWISAIGGNSDIGLSANRDIYLKTDNGGSLKGGTTQVTVKQDGNVGIGTTSPQAKLQVSGGIQMADDTDTASASKVGTMRYRTGTEYVEVDGVELVPSVATIVNAGGGTITQISGNSYSSTSDGTSGSSIRPKFDFATTAGTTYKLLITPTGAITGTVNFDFYDGASYLFQNYDFTTDKDIYFTDNGTVFAAFDGVNAYSIAGFTISITEVTAEDASYADMCMQTAASTYEWVNIVRNSY